MTLHDRATHGKAYSHAAAFCGVEGVEESVGVVSIESDASITHAQVYVGSIGAGGDDQLTRTIVDGAHGIARVQQQVEDHLLELDLAHGKRDDLSRRLVQVD